MHRIPPEMTERARQLRREATPAERQLWRLLSSYRPRFTRQLVVGNYIVDLACREAKLAVELDGSQHAESAVTDAERTAFLERAGFLVLRFWNNQVFEEMDGVLEVIWRALKGRAAPSPTRPPP